MVRSGTPSGCGLNYIKYRWSSPDKSGFDHRLLSCNPSGSLAASQPQIDAIDQYLNMQK